MWPNSTAFPPAPDPARSSTQATGRARTAKRPCRASTRCWPRSACIIETNDEGGNQPTADYAAARGLDLEGLAGIASSIGHMLGKLFTSPALGTLLLTGGDTLLQCMNCVGIKELEPVCEMEKVASCWPASPMAAVPADVITKSGGFGHETAARPCRPHCSQIKLR